MTRQATYHPERALLRDFFDGTLATGINLVITAHVDDCPACRQSMAEIAESTSNDWYETTASNGAPEQDFSDVLQGILKQPLPDASAPSQAVTASEGPLKTFSLRDQCVRLPHALQCFAMDGFIWEEIGKGIHQALLSVDSATKCELIVMDPGAKVPRHKHMGQEFMLVLGGSLCDDSGTYHVADFLAFDQQVHHGQATENGCACLFITDAPLVFTDGLARLLNPLNRIKYWWSGKSGGRTS